MKKEEEDKGGWRAAGLTIKNGSKPCIYKGLTAINEAGKRKW